MVMAEEEKTKMEQAAVEATEALKPIIAKYPEAAEAFGSWIKAWYPTAGYKRLGRLLVSQGG